MLLFRRFVWNFFRLENEHLNNCGEFRAVRDISVTPFHADDIRTLEKMVDDHDGVEHVLFENYEKNASSVEMKNLKKARFVSCYYCYCNRIDRFGIIHSDEHLTFL